MKLKRVLLSLCMALTFVFAFALAGCSDCITETIEEPASNRPSDPSDPEDEWTNNH